MAKCGGVDFRKVGSIRNKCRVEVGNIFFRVEKLEVGFKMGKRGRSTKKQGQLEVGTREIRVKKKKVG